MPSVTNVSEIKAKSIGWLLGRLLVFCNKVIKELGDNPTHKELVDEAKGLIKRWDVERRIK